MSAILNVLFFHLIYDILAGSHRKGQDGPGDIFISLRNKGSTIHAKKVFTVVRLAVFI
jgi:hypothetical protein